MTSEKIRRVQGYQDPFVNELARDVSRVSDSVLPLTLHEMTNFVWNPPHTVFVPFFGGKARLTPPKIVRCDRATDVSGAVDTTPGGCSWRWVGDGSAEVLDVSGLVAGTKYDLVFTVIG